MAQKVLSRLTIDISVEDHRRLKALAAVYGKSMREIVIQSIQILLNHMVEIKRENEENILN